MSKVTLEDTLYEMIERINDDSLTKDELEITLHKAKAIDSIAKTIIAGRAQKVKLLDVIIKANGMGIDEIESTGMKLLDSRQ